MKNFFVFLFIFMSSYCVMADQLTIERIYDDPSLEGSAPVQLKLSPDGTRVSYLKSSADDYLRLDLWEYHIADQVNRLLVDAKKLVPEEGELSDVEKARRERQRIGNTGIIEYSWSKQGDALLFPLGGDLYYYDLNEQAVTQLTQSDAFETDSRFSPQGNYVSFIRNQNLFVVDVKSQQEMAITTEGGGLISFGMAEFIAQEEMDRDTGYWWSSDESAIAFTRVDESPVGVEQRYEIYADELKVFDQRYPKTGSNNAIVSVGIADLNKLDTETSERNFTWVDLGEDTDIYVPRVKWLPDNKTLSVQRQSRDQKILELLFANRKTGTAKVVLKEEDKFWTRLHHSLHFLKEQKAFIWGSDHSGFHHLGLYDYEGNKLKDLSRGDWEVTELLGFDEKTQTVYFMANALTPLEQHLYAVSIESEGVSQLKQLSTRSGWHGIDLSDDKQFYIDRFSNATTPPQVSLHAIDGKLLTFLDENKLDDKHPYFPYWSEHVKPEYGSIRASDDQKLYYQLFRPAKFDPAKKYPVIIEVYGGPGVQRVRNN